MKKVSKIGNFIHCEMRWKYLQKSLTVKKYCWEIHLMNKIEKYCWEIQLRNTAGQMKKVSKIGNFIRCEPGWGYLQKSLTLNLHGVLFLAKVICWQHKDCWANFVHRVSVYSWETKLRNTVEKYIWWIKVRNTDDTVN